MLSSPCSIYFPLGHRGPPDFVLHRKGLHGLDSLASGQGSRNDAPPVAFRRTSAKAFARGRVAELAANWQF